MEDTLGTKTVLVTDQNGHGVKDEEGNVAMKSLNDEWHIFFREGLATAPAMLFSLTESWCQSPDCHVQLVWNLVLKTLGAEELLRIETREVKVDDIEADDGHDDLQKEEAALVSQFVEECANYSSQVSGIFVYL